MLPINIYNINNQLSNMLPEIKTINALDIILGH